MFLKKRRASFQQQADDGSDAAVDDAGEEDYGVCDGAVETTQSLLGAVIAKPPLKAKLLQRPPFRFLHDVVMEVTAATGFASGLFAGDETDARAATPRKRPN